MSETGRSLFDEHIRFTEIAQPIWDNICDKLERFYLAVAGSIVEGYVSPEFPGEVYDWEMFLVDIDDEGYSMPGERPSMFTSHKGFAVTSGFAIELWFAERGDRRPKTTINKPDAEFVDDPHIIIICTRIGVYDGYTGQLLGVEDLNKLQIDIDRLIAASA